MKKLMKGNPMIKRIVAISIIFVASWLAWLILSATMERRTNEKDALMTDMVGGLWGTEHTQIAPASDCEMRDRVAIPIQDARK